MYIGIRERETENEKKKMKTRASASSMEHKTQKGNKNDIEVYSKIQYRVRWANYTHSLLPSLPRSLLFLFVNKLMLVILRTIMGEKKATTFTEEKLFAFFFYSFLLEARVVRRKLELIRVRTRTWLF